MFKSIFATFILLISIQIPAKEFKIPNDYSLVGKGLLEYSIFGFDVYEISYFKGPNNTSALKLDYKNDVKRKYSQQGWEKGLKPLIKENPEYKEQLDWLLKNTKDVKEGDVIVIRKVDEKTEFYKNGEMYASTDDKIISKIVYAPWLGKSPVDQDLKMKLLNNED